MPVGRMAHCGVFDFLFQQGLCHFLTKELSNYHDLLATLELQMGSETASLPPPTPTAFAPVEPSLESPSSSTFDDDSPDPRTAAMPEKLVKCEIEVGDSEMTFQRLKLWVEDSLMKLRVMGTLVQAAQREFRGSPPGYRWMKGLGSQG